MKFKRFRKNNRRNTMLIIAVVLIVGLVVSTTLIKSHAYFKTTKSFNVIEGKIPNNGDVKLAILVDNEKQNTFPDKKNYKYVETVCNEDSNADINFDINTWKLNIDNIDSKTICTIYFESKNEYEEEILKGSYPVIKEGLVPVVISDNGEVTKANLNDKWYSYANSRWANAVILKQNPSKTYNVGDAIKEDDIESYFVWIPKYRYKLFNVEGESIPEQEIEIKFGTTNTDNSDSSCEATNESGNDGTCENGKWMTHPAFTSLGVNGIWVGKFETTGTTDAVTVKPNVASLKNITGKVMYDKAFNYKRTNDNNNLDSHMMKNTEWGAVAYLTNSNYGRLKNQDKETWQVYINNSSTYTTGCAGNTVSESAYNGCQNAWNTSNGYHASTANNISGIYDMSGGAYEYVMGNYNNTPSSSGITTWPASKYYDKYTGETSSARILGDATGETYGWNGDYTNFVDSSTPWFIRGGFYSNTTNAGVFFFNNSYGGAGGNLSFRLVLSPTK